MLSGYAMGIQSTLGFENLQQVMKKGYIQKHGNRQVKLKAGGNAK